MLTLQRSQSPDSQRISQLKKDVVISVQNVSKKFCRSLRKSMYYGIQDLANQFVGRKLNTSQLRNEEFWGLKDINFELKKGESLALLGPNGSGKTTLLRILAGVLPPDEGVVITKGRLNALIALGAGFHPHFSGRENIYLNGTILGMTKSEIDQKFDDIINFSEIHDFLDAPVSTYSSGMRVRLGYAISAHIEPTILLIDEILAVGDVKFRMKCYNHILGLIDKGTSIVMVSHNMNDVSRVTNRGIVLDHGKVVYSGDLSMAVSQYETLNTSFEDTHNLKGLQNSPKIECVNLTNSSGQKTTEFNTGDCILVEMTIRSEKTIKDCRLVTAIASPSSGILGSFATPYKNFRFDLMFPKIVIRLTLRDIPLLVGGYHLNISLLGPNITDFYDRKTPATSFQITGPQTDAYGFGVANIFQFDHEWEKVI